MILNENGVSLFPKLRHPVDVRGTKIFNNFSPGRRHAVDQFFKTKITLPTCARLAAYP